MQAIGQLTEELLAPPSASRAFLAEKLSESLKFDIDSVHFYQANAPYDWIDIYATNTFEKARSLISSVRLRFI
jgi:hypothetical protein